jgi:hypothetical protein
MCDGDVKPPSADPDQAGAYETVLAVRDQFLRTSQRLLKSVSVGTIFPWRSCGTLSSLLGSHTASVSTSGAGVPTYSL